MAPPPQPDLPNPAHANRDSALARKFGKEITNYFGGLSAHYTHPYYSRGTDATAGSPLNRLSFLREESSFLAGAFEHPSTKFVVFKNLSPLIKAPTELHYAVYEDIRALVPSNPFDKSEEEVIKEFNSSIDTPQLVFLGIDENVTDGYKYRNFAGAPHFAIDITPKKTFEQTANEVAEKFLSSGLVFVEGMRAMSFHADTGESHQRTSCRRGN